MRILNIYFKNINSLKGEGRVNFDQGPIADSGVFAITGPNGSGKTSILDVITLGMYGETFRFNKPAEHIITKHTDESFAQVEFEFAGEKYRSHWQVSRADPTNPTMTLAVLRETPGLLAETPNRVRGYLAELTGMDFHGFCKSIVLPQGDFAAFLNALDSERMDILEKISGSGIYTDFRRQAEEKNATLREKTALLEREADLIPVLSDEAIEAAEHDLRDFQEIAEDLKIQDENLQAQLNDLQYIVEIETRRGQLEQQRQQLDKEIAKESANLQRLDFASQAAQFKNDKDALDRLTAETQQSREMLLNLRGELSILQQQAAASGDIPDIGKLIDGKTLGAQKKIVDELKLEISRIKLDSPRENELSQTIRLQLAEKQTTLTEVRAWLDTHQADTILTVDFPDIARLRNIRTEMAEIAGKLKSQGSVSKRIYEALNKNKSALAAGQSRIAELEKQIETQQQTQSEITQGKSLAELIELQRDQQSRFKDFQALYELANINARLGVKKGLFNWFRPAKEPEQTDPSEIQSRVESLKIEIEKEDNITRTLEQAITNENLLKKLSGYRNKLVEGKPCYLCGSLQHPYTFKPPAATDFKKALADQRGKILVLKATLEIAEKELANVEKRNSQLTAKQKFLREKRSEWLMLANRLNIVRDGLDIGNLELQKTLLSNEAEELKKINGLIQEHRELQRGADKARAEIPARRTAIEKLAPIVMQLETDWNNRSPELVELERKYADLQVAEKSLVQHLDAQLGKLGEKLPGKSKENALFDRLNSRRQDYQIRELRLTGLTEEIAGLQENLRIHESAALEYQQQLRINQENLQNQELIYLHLSVRDKQARIIMQEQLQAEQEQNLEIRRRYVTEKIAEKGFVNLEQITELLLLLDNQQEIRENLDRHTRDLAALNSQIEQLTVQIDLAINQRGVSGLSMDGLSAEQDALAQKIDIVEQEIRTLHNKLEKQYQARHKHQQLESELSELRGQLIESEAEIAQINDGQGGLRRRVQLLLTDRLLSQANGILEKISGRYYVRRAVSEHGLALEIEDTRQKNVRRLPKTLSGGESFVVSLALALALAENAGNGKSIESLFLDEGFGNLDAEALYMAMSALENLKIQGKTVGVISHVDAVKKRIKTQIELVKNANGHSELKMVA